MFALSFGFAQTNDLTQTSVGEGLAPPVLCSHHLAASTDVHTYQEPSPVGEGGSRRLTDEVSISLFALPFGGAQTNENHLTPCRDRASGQQVASLSVSLFAPSFGFAQITDLSISVGVGAFDDPRKALIYNGLSRTPVPTMCVGVGAPPYCLFSPSVFSREEQPPPLRDHWISPVSGVSFVSGVLSSTSRSLKYSSITFATTSEA